MKKLTYFAALMLLFACTPESNPGNGDRTRITVVKLTGIALTEHEITLEKGENKVLEVAFTPEDATDKQLSWWSFDPNIVTVSDGTVVGVAPGTAEISVKSGSLTDYCQVTVVISAASVSLDQTSLTLAPGKTVTLKATVLPEDSTDEVEWSSSDETVATVDDGKVTADEEGETTITAKAGDKTATCRVKVEFKMVAVDLGLPSGLKWAECNLGAKKPEHYGDYYAWGDVEPYYSSMDPLIWKEGKTGYDWASYTWCNGAFNKLTKYCPKDKASSWDAEGSPDGNIILQPEDDAAHVIAGGNWRMPTDENWTELRTECTWRWTTQNGVNGRLVAGKNGNSIFLPAAGYWYDTVFGNEGSFGCYWSSSLNVVNPYLAMQVYFYSEGVDSDDVFRYYGQPIRPVIE